MTHPHPDLIRDPTLFDAAAEAAAAQDAAWTARGQNFRVDWRRAGAGGATLDIDSGDEALVLLPESGGARLVAQASTSVPVNAPGRSICIVPAGRWQVVLEPGATGVVLTSLREHEAAPAARNAALYAERDPRIVTVGAPYRALRDADVVRVLPVEQVAASRDKPRLKMLQTATLSINWVEYDGPRDRRQLSPHAHTAFEQGSLALAGDFVHHLRAPWGENADAWQDDRHAALGSPSLMVVPVNLIHTSEGVGPGRHLLIDVFSPPRADFIAKGWVYNAGDYAPPAA